VGSVIKLVFIMMAAGVLVLSGCGGDSSESKSKSQEATSQDTQMQEAVPDTVFPRMEFAAGTPEAEMQDVILEVISYFQKDDVEGMMYRFIPEQRIKELEESDGFYRVARRYNMFRDDMVVVLKEALTLQPQFNEDTTVVIYEVQSGPSDLVFVKLEDRWYFPDK
jgi:PBP1b-binding outer membrane lipoprotein LpoB